MQLSPGNCPNFQSMVNCTVSFTTPECQYLNTNFELDENDNQDGWSGSFGDMSVNVVYVGDDGSGNPRFTGQVSVTDCATSDTNEATSFTCSPLDIAIDVFVPVSACCPNSHVHLQISGGDIRPRGKEPEARKICDVPEERLQCCWDAVANGGGVGNGSGGNDVNCTPDGCFIGNGDNGSAGGGGGGKGGGRNNNVAPTLNLSSQPIRYATGQLYYRETDIAADGFGVPWGHTRYFANKLSFSETIGNGYNWQVQQWPYAIIEANADVTIQGRPLGALFFTESGGSYTAKFGSKEQLTLNGTTNRYELTTTDGAVTEFQDSNGRFLKYTSAAGVVVEVKEGGAYADSPNGFSPRTVERVYNNGMDDITEQLNYEYDSTLGDALLETLTLRRKVGAGAWQNVQRVNYTYYDYSDTYGSGEDLKTVVTENWDGYAWVETGTSYYRYDTSLVPGTQLPTHLLKYAVGPESYKRLTDYLGTTSIDAASNAQVAQYADYYFEYDSSRRVTKEAVNGGAREYTFAYSESAHSDDYNAWKTRTIETLPDGSRNIIYSNYAGQAVFTIYEADADLLNWETLTVDEFDVLTVDEWYDLALQSDQWCKFYRYDSDGRRVYQANPSAITGFDESLADLVGFNVGTGAATHLRASDGLIRTWTHHSASGFVESESIQQGTSGTSIKLREFEYVACTETGFSDVYKMSKQVLYPTDTDQAGNKLTTTYSYTWHSGTAQPEIVTTTLPVVPTAQNGSNTAATTKDDFNAYGYNTWRMDERGFLTRMEYDVVTGAMTQRIDDVDVTQTTDEPSGWTTPAGGGLHLITDYEHDDLGRTTQILGPSHDVDISGTNTTVRRATWIVYEDSDDQDVVITGQGYATGSAPSYTLNLVNPVSITKTQKNGKIAEQIQAVSSTTTGTVAAMLGTSSGYSQSNYTRWTTHQYSDCCLLASSRVYHTIPTSGTGASGTNYDQTDFGYDSRRRRHRSVTPGGTITRQVLDVRGLVTAVYVGTDDTGGTEQDPTGGGAMGNNMVLVSAYEYDSGADGGDGNLTQVTQHVDGSTTRVTTHEYDWRNRRIATDGEIDHYESYTLDNLGRVTQSERYDTTSSGNLVARSETKYDARGRVYETVTHAVDPDTGTVGSSLTDDIWYDDAGNITKVSPKDIELSREFTYDSLNRQKTEKNPLNAVTTYVYDDAGNRTSLTDAESNVTTWKYDAIGRMVKETNELNDTRTFAYDNAGSLDSRTDRNGRVIEFDYDDRGRVTTERWRDGMTTVNTITTSYNADGQIENISDSDSAYAYTYDDRMRPATASNSGTSGVPTVVLTSAYNTASERTSVSTTINSVSDATTAYQYDVLGRMDRVTQTGPAGAIDKRVDWTWRVIGGPSVMTRYEDLTATNAVASTEFDYDDYARLTGQLHKQGGTTLGDYDVTFDADRRVDSMTVPAGSTDFTHDDAGQLTLADHTYQTDESFSYDQTGNRTLTGYVTGDNNQLLDDGSHTYTYDDEGNRTRKTETSSGDYVEYAWDHRNRLTEVTFKTSGGTKTKQLQYAYDVYNRRIKRTVDTNGDGTFDATERFVYDAGVKQGLEDILYVFDGSNNLERRLLHGFGIDHPLCVETSSDAQWLLASHLGTITDVAEYDPGTTTTTIANRLTYTAFGVIAAETNPAKTPHYAFTAREWDEDADLYYYRARWYDPAVGRFVSEDPIGFKDSPNTYLYVRNLPHNYFDPSGFITALGGCALGAIGSGLGSLFSGLSNAGTGQKSTCVAVTDALCDALGGCITGSLVASGLGWLQCGGIGAVVGVAVQGCKAVGRGFCEYTQNSCDAFTWKCFGIDVAQSVISGMAACAIDVEVVEDLVVSLIFGNVEITSNLWSGC